MLNDLNSRQQRGLSVLELIQESKLDRELRLKAEKVEPRRIPDRPASVKGIKTLITTKNLNKRNEKFLTKFLVYAAKYNGEIIYIGSGVNGREKHCISGCSHVYELNRLHFSKQVVEVEALARFMTKEESLVAETTLIIEHKPRFNKLDNPHISSEFQFSLIERWDDYFKTFGEYKHKLYLKVFRDLIQRFTIPELVSESGVAITGMRLTDDSSVKTHRLSIMISCKVGPSKYNKHYEEIHNAFCTIEGRIKIPIYPPEYKERE